MIRMMSILIFGLLGSQFARAEISPFPDFSIEANSHCIHISSRHNSDGLHLIYNSREERWFHQGQNPIPLADGGLLVHGIDKPLSVQLDHVRGTALISREASIFEVRLRAMSTGDVVRPAALEVDLYNQSLERAVPVKSLSSI